MNNYDLLRQDRNRNRGGVACSIRNDISYIQKHYFPEEIKNIFFEILLPKTKPILVRIIYRSPSQINFLNKIINKNFPFSDTYTKEMYFNINMSENNKYIVQENNIVCGKFAFANAKKYHPFCTMHGLKQLIQYPTRVTRSISTIINHILASFPLRDSQKGVINVGLSDHQLIFCKRKISKFKTGGVHKYINFLSLKSYKADDYKKSRGQLFFLNYEIFDDANAPYSHFFQKIVTVIDKIAPFKAKRVKGDTQKWFDGEVLEEVLFFVNEKFLNLKQVVFTST